VRTTIACLLLLLASAEAGARHACLERLDGMGVPYREARRRPGIAIPIEVTGPVGGVTYETWSDRPLILDCSLVYSLAKAGRYLVEAGLTRARYSSAYQRRNVRGTNRPSKHSYGLAIDLHSLGDLEVADDYEQGLGDGMDCIGAPLTAGGTLLRTVLCRMERSGLFRNVLSPDYDEDHWNHFHVEALPWVERDDLQRDAATESRRRPAMTPRETPTGIR
jgi:hypothetical protein